MKTKDTKSIKEYMNYIDSNDIDSKDYAKRYYSRRIYLDDLNRYLVGKVKGTINEGVGDVCSGIMIVLEANDGAAKDILKFYKFMFGIYSIELTEVYVTYNTKARKDDLLEPEYSKVLSSEINCLKPGVIINHSDRLLDEGMAPNVININREAFADMLNGVNLREAITKKIEKLKTEISKEQFKLEKAVAQGDSADESEATLEELGEKLSKAEKELTELDKELTPKKAAYFKRVRVFLNYKGA